MVENKPVELDECPNPWCEDGVALVEEREGGFYRVGCTCGVSSPPATSEDKAVAIWNRQSTDPLTAAPRETLDAKRRQGQREGKAAVCQWLRGFTAMKPSPEGAEKVAQLADMFERSEQAMEALPSHTEGEGS